MIGLFVPLLILLVSSGLAIGSVSTHLLLFHLAWMTVGGCLMLLFRFIDWRSIFNYRFFVSGLYIATVILLGIALVNPAIRNVRSWIVLGPFTFQPVELAKITLIIAYASYFSRRHIAVASFSTIFGSLALLIPPMVLTLIQPDLGSATILGGIWFSFLLASGLPKRHLAMFAAIFIVFSILAWNYGLRPYQKQRILGLFHPEQNALTVNYSVIQSRIAIGSAGFWGKGFGQGTQTQLGFLSEPANDFVLSAFVEEWGYAGGVVLLSALAVLICSVLVVGASSGRNFERFFCIGTAAMWTLQFAINAGSATGLFPVVGVTFPFVSYGGSSLLANFFLISIVYAIYRTARN